MPRRKLPSVFYSVGPEYLAWLRRQAEARGYRDHRGRPNPQRVLDDACQALAKQDQLDPPPVRLPPVEPRN